MSSAKGPVTVETAPEEWVVLKGSHRGAPLLARFNRSFRRASDRSSYPVQIGVAIPLRAPRPDGFPETDEMAQLDAIEEAVERQAHGQAVLVGVITTSGMREFVLYTRTEDWIPNFHAHLQATVGTHEVQMMAKRDPVWDTYGYFVE